MVDLSTVQMSMSMLASTLSIASSVSKFMSEKHIGAQEALALFRQSASDKQRITIDDNSARSAILQMTVISASLLSLLSDEAQECEDHHIDKRRRATTDTEKTQADIEAAVCMCRVLRDIRRYNKGALPDYLQNWWDSYGCSP